MLATANFCGKCGADMSAIQSKSNDMVGELIGGRYRIKELIGSGGMGEVYLALHEELGQKVAIKFLAKRMVDDPHIVKRFFQEARTTCRVNHPNAVSLNDFGRTDDGSLYIIMEYIEGEALSDVVERDGFLPLETCIDIVLQLADVLDAAHKEGVIHRDLKPDNIMLTPVRGGRYAVKVLDFGIARLISDDGSESRLTQAGMVFGTPEFMSPEQCKGDDADGRSDQYALAICFYYLLCGGILPFYGDNRVKILNRQINEAPVLPSEQVAEAGIPASLEAVLMKALNKAPETRYASVSDFADAIEEVVATLRDSGTFDAKGRPLIGVKPKPRTAAPVAKKQKLKSMITSIPGASGGFVMGDTPEGDADSGAWQAGDAGETSTGGWEVGDGAGKMDTAMVMSGPSERDDEGDFGIEIEPGYSPGRSSSGGLIIGVIVALILLGGIAAFALTSGSEDPEEVPVEADAQNGVESPEKEEADEEAGGSDAGDVEEPSKPPAEVAEPPKEETKVPPKETQTDTKAAEPKDVKPKDPTPAPKSESKKAEPKKTTSKKRTPREKKAPIKTKKVKTKKKERGGLPPKKI